MWYEVLFPFHLAHCALLHSHGFCMGMSFFQQVLGKVDVLRKRIVSLGKEHASLCAKVRKINSELNADYIASTMLLLIALS